MPEAPVSTCQAGLAAVFYVAPDGNDAWSGRLSEPNAAGADGPFKTIERARDEIRNLNIHPLVCYLR